MYKAGGAKDPSQRSKRDLLINKSWSYLFDNFHKFSQDNKIKIALELAKKNIPNEVMHSGSVEHNVFFESMISKAIPNRISEHVSQN